MKENQRIAVTKRMLKEGLLRLLKTKELKKIKISELCAESGVNRATFYRHYETPQDVLLELERDMVRQIFPAPSRPQTLQEAQLHLESLCAYLHDNAEIMKILFRCNAEVDMVERLNEFYIQFSELRKQEPQFAAIDEESGKLIATLLAGGSYCLLRQWIMEDIPKSPKQIAAIMCNVYRWPAVDGHGEVQL